MSTPNDITSRGQRNHPLAGAPEIPREEPTQADRVQTEHAVRTAATMAAQMEGGSLPRGVVDFIVASSDFRQNRQALEARAASIANHVVNDVRAPNFSGAHPNDVKAYLASIGREFGDYRRHMVLAGSGSDTASEGGATSSARLDVMSSSDAKFLSDMRGHATRCGLHWAADKPEILRLGPAAIETLAQANFKKETFQKLKQAGYVGGDAVAIARFANETGKDANEIGSAAAKVTSALPPADAEVHRRAVRDLVGAKTEAEREAAGQKLDQVHKDLGQKDPKLQGDIENLERTLGRKKGEELKATNRADVKDQKADGKDIRAAAEQQHQQERVQTAASSMADDWNAPASTGASRHAANTPATQTSEAQQNPQNKAQEGQKESVKTTAKQRVTQAPGRAPA